MKTYFRQAVALAAVVAAFHSIGQVADAEAFSASDVLTPRPLSEAQCGVLRQAVWVSTSWNQQGLFGQSTQSAAGCIRLFISDNVHSAKSAIIFFPGDMDGLKESAQAQVAYEKQATFTALNATAERMATLTGSPVIIVGRPGTFGSTGMDHIKERRLPIEVHLLDKAVDKIKEKYGFERVTLAGQSGGGGVVGALLTRGRDDIDCAVIGSGAVSVKSRVRLHPNSPKNGTDIGTGQPLNKTYDPIEHVAGIAQDPSRRIIVLGDLRDTRVAFASQREFHEKLLTLGLQSTLIEGTATGTDFHGMTVPAYRTAGWCRAKIGDEGIRLRLKP